MPGLFSIVSDLFWPLAIAAAWIAGEFGHRWSRLPRIGFYVLLGFALTQSPLGVVPGLLRHNDQMLILADIAFGLILFEMGFRINLRWLFHNPWLTVAAVVGSGACFGVAYLVATQFGATPVNALLLASLVISTSPASVIRVINEERSSGQVTERILHLTAFNCVLSIFLFNAIVGFSVFHAGDPLNATLNSIGNLLASAGLGALFGVLAPFALFCSGRRSQDATVAFALFVIVLVMLTYATGLSTLMATLAFGLVARHRRVAFSQTQRNFGPLGEILTVLLFVFAASTLEWQKVLAGAGLALALIAACCFSKVIGVASFSHLSGISWRKGALTGLALTPVSVFVILLLEHARYQSLVFSSQLNALIGITLMLELIGPFMIQRALIWARETQHNEEG